MSLLLLISLLHLSHICNGSENECQNGYFWSQNTAKCSPCQEESVAYFGHNLKDFAPLKQITTLRQCQKHCFTTKACSYWTHDAKSNLCYLKTHRSEPTNSTQFISGVKDCSRRSTLGKNTLPIVITYNTTKTEDNVVKMNALPATFGLEIGPKIQAEGEVSHPRQKPSSMCSPELFDMANRGRFAIAQRGTCQFITKAIHAQMAGYSGLIVVDNAKDTPFSRIIAGKDNAHPESFVKIPIAFLRLAEASKLLGHLSQHQKLKLTLSPNQDASAEQSSKPPTLSLMKETDSSSIKFPGHNEDAEKDKVDEEKVLKAEMYSPLTLVFFFFIIVLAVLVITMGLIYLINDSCCKFPGRRRNQVCGYSDSHPGTQLSISPLVVVLPREEPDVQPDPQPNQMGFESRATLGGTSGGVVGSPPGLEAELECPVCFELPQKKIFQCSNGHIICEDCYLKLQLKSCPECREDWSSGNTNWPGRNIRLENMSRALRRDSEDTAYLPSAPPFVS